jgi:hypothetical protein
LNPLIKFSFLSFFGPTHCLVNHPTVRQPLPEPPDNDADEAPGVLVGRRRFGYATTSDAGLLLSDVVGGPLAH